MSKITENTGKYDELKDELKIENDLSTQNEDLITACKIGLRKLRLAKDFASIDAKIMEASSKRDSNDFFSGILSLEAKRLAFKEEALKCLEEKLQVN